MLSSLLEPEKAEGDGPRLPLELIRRIISFLTPKHVTPLMRVSKPVQEVAAAAIYRRTPIVALIHAHPGNGRRYLRYIEHLVWNQECPCGLDVIHDLTPIELPKLHTVTFEYGDLEALDGPATRALSAIMPKTIVMPSASAENYRFIWCDKLIPTDHYIFVVDMAKNRPPPSARRLVNIDFVHKAGIQTKTKKQDVTIILRPDMSLHASSCPRTTAIARDWKGKLVLGILSGIFGPQGEMYDEPDPGWLIVGAENLDDSCPRPNTSREAQRRALHSFRAGTWQYLTMLMIVNMRSDAAGSVDGLQDPAWHRKVQARLDSLRWMTLQDYIDNELDEREIAREEAESWLKRY